MGDGVTHANRDIVGPEDFRRPTVDDRELGRQEIQATPWRTYYQRSEVEETRRLLRDLRDQHGGRKRTQLLHTGYLILDALLAGEAIQIQNVSGGDNS